MKINSSQKIYEGRVFTLVKESLSLPGGAETEIDILRHPGAAAVVALTDKHELVMVRQYRHAVGDFLWEIPAGTLEGDETPSVCAKRELEEESGYRAESFEKIGEILPVPGYSNERIHIFLASGLRKGQSRLDHDEYLTVHLLDFDNAFGMVERGRIQDAKTIAGLFRARTHLEKNK